MLSLFIEKDFESEGRKRKRKKNKNKNRKHKKLLYMWKILTKDGIYCSYLKCICSSKAKYYKSQDEYLGN